MPHDPDSPFTAQVQQHLGKPTLFVNDQPVLPMFYALTHQPGGRWTFDEQPQFCLRQFCRQGVRLFQVELQLGEIFDADGRLDVDRVRRQTAGIGEACPDGALVIRLVLHPNIEWTKAHPLERCEFANPGEYDEQRWGSPVIIERDAQRPLRPSLASKVWRNYSTGQLVELLRTLADGPEGNRIIGFQPACGVFGEWHYWGFIHNDPDTGPAMTAAFRDWLGRTYGDDATLSHAWDDPAAAVATAAVPDVAARNAIADGIFRDPVRHRRVIDYYRCQQELTANLLLHFCSVVKQTWPRPHICGAFYGYFFMMFGRQAAGGHLELQRVLGSPHLDYLSAPQSYWGTAHNPGGSGQSRAVLGAVTRAGKLNLDEMDQNTSLHPVNAYRTLKPTLDQDVALVRRNVVQPYTRGHGLWFYDFGVRYNAGWWCHPTLLAEVHKLRQVLADKHETPFRRHADVLVIYDTEVFYHTADKPDLDPVSVPMLDEFSADLYRSGVSFEDAMLFELERIDLAPYCAVVFTNTWHMTDAQRRLVRDRVMRDGRHVVWNYMPGYSNGRRLDQGFVEELTGMRLKRVDPQNKPETVVDAVGFPQTRHGVGQPVPVLVVDDPAAEPIAHFEGTNHVAIARKNLPDVTCWFCSLPLRGPALLHRIFREAGAHAYVDAGTVLHEGGGVIAVHTADPAARRVTLRGGRTVDVDVPVRSTVLLDSETGELLIR